MGLLHDLARCALRWGARHDAAPRVGNFLVRAHAEAGRARLTPGPTFRDARGREHRLLHGLRDLLVPRWRGALVAPAPPTPAQEQVRLEGTLNHGRAVLAPALQVLRGHGFELAGKRVLDLGCGEGPVTCALAAGGAAEVVGTEYIEYQKSHAGDEPPDASIRRRFRAMAEAGAAFHGQPDLAARVRLEFDDIGASALEPGSFDLVVSWNVLEHLPDPEAAMAGIARLLAPGGLAFHEYNPFFCATGGHSLSTLDIPWGHVVLDAADLRAYLERFRPEEVEKGARFHGEHLNRMTLADLRAAGEAAGLVLGDLVPFLEDGDLAQVDAALLDAVHALYPGATVVDLAARRVWVVHRRPGEGAGGSAGGGGA